MSLHRHAGIRAVAAGLLAALLAIGAPCPAAAQSVAGLLDRTDAARRGIDGSLDGDESGSEIQIGASQPLRMAGPGSLALKSSLLVRGNRIIDPRPGVSRRQPDDERAEASVIVIRSLPARHARWGMSYAFWRETGVRHGSPYKDRIDAFVEYRPGKRWTFKMFYTSRATGPIVNEGRYFGIELRRRFGG